MGLGLAVAVGTAVVLTIGGVAPEQTHPHPTPEERTLPAPAVPATPDTSAEVVTATPAPSTPAPSTPAPSTPAPSTAAPSTPPASAPAAATAPEQDDAPSDKARGPRCVVPKAPIPRAPGCDAGLPYPHCRWRVPHPAAGSYLYSQWRNTSNEQWWGRPALVSLIMAASADYARLYPGEVLAIGDLDAPGPRHETHDRGVDVDLYLPGMMQVENEGGGEYAENYADQPPISVRMLRSRVEDLARILTTCADGRVRIYYNDRVVRRRYHRWFREEGFRSPFGRPMQKHNDLHRFHFHLTIPDDLPPLPMEPAR